MYSVIWILVVFLAADAVEHFGTDNLPKSELLLARPQLIEAFKSLLHRALGSEGTYQRDLLIVAGIIEAPPSYESPKDVGSGVPPEIPLSPEMQEYFTKQITDILTSLDKLEYALNKLFGERLLQSHFIDPEDSHQKLAEHLKSYQSDDILSNVSKRIHNMSKQESTEVDYNEDINSGSESCKDSFKEISELPAMSAVNFAMTSQAEITSENEIVTSHSVVDKITSDYINAFSETPDSSISSSDLHESSTSEQNEISPLTTFDDAFLMHLMSSSISPSANELSTNSDESTSDFEGEFLHSTAPLPSGTVTESTESEALETESTHGSSEESIGRVLTLEEVQLLDESLTLRPELKYHVISTFDLDLEPLPDVYFATSDETPSSKPLGKKRRRVNPRGISLEEPIFYQAPTPNKMLLRYYRDIPDTSFTCENKSLPGFYADQETDCQVFHVCWPGRRESFLCPVGSLFNQRVLSCDNFNNTNCSLSNVYFDINSAFQEYDDAKALNVTPIPDPLMRPLQNDSGTTAIVINKADIVELFEADLHFSDMVNKTNITELWEYLPVKAKVFVYPEPADLKTFLLQHRHHKVRKSKDVRGLKSSTEAEEFEVAPPDDILEKRQRIEANIIRVLKKLSRKHRD